MLPGKEGRHAWTPPGAEEPAVTLGLRRDDEGKEVWPYFHIRRITGTRSAGEAEDNASARVGGLGLDPERSERRGKIVAYEGTIKARTLRDLREAEDTLQAAFADITELGRMDCTWHPDNEEFADAPAVFYEAKCLTCDIPDDQATRGYEREFVVGLHQYDPRHFDEETEAHEVEVSETNEAVEFT